MADSKGDSTPSPEPTNVFTRTVTVSKEDLRTGNPIRDAAGVLVPGRILGEFSFKIATIRDRLNIGVRRTFYLGGHPPERLDPETVLLAECAATLPVVIVDAPHGWPKKAEEWETWLDHAFVTEDRALYALYNAYVDGVRTFRGDSHKGAPP